MKGPVISKDDFNSFVMERMLGVPSGDLPHDFETVFCGNAYSVVFSEILEKYPASPETVLMLARFRLAFLNGEAASVMIIDKKMNIKGITSIARRYRAKLSEFHDDIAYLCEKHHSKKCIVMFNYSYKCPILDELADINRLYYALQRLGITLADCVKVSDGNAVSLIMPYNSNGYIK